MVTHLEVITEIKHCPALAALIASSEIQLIHSSIQSGSRLFGFIGAGATLGQLFGSVFAAVTAWLGPCMLIFPANLESLMSKLICFFLSLHASVVLLFVLLVVLLLG